MALAAHPTKVYLKASGSAVSGGDEVDGVNKNSIKINGEQLDVSKFKSDAGWRLFIQGLKGATMEISGFAVPADGPQNLARTSLLTYADLWCTILANPGGTTGQKGFVAQVDVESYNQDGDVGGLVTFTTSLKVTGAVAVDS